MQSSQWIKASVGAARLSPLGQWVRSSRTAEAWPSGVLCILPCSEVSISPGPFPSGSVLSLCPFPPPPTQQSVDTVSPGLSTSTGPDVRPSPGQVHGALPWPGIPRPLSVHCMWHVQPHPCLKDRHADLEATMSHWRGLALAPTALPCPLWPACTLGGTWWGSPMRTVLPQRGPGTLLLIHSSVYIRLSQGDQPPGQLDQVAGDKGPML